MRILVVFLILSFGVESEPFKLPLFDQTNLDRIEIEPVLDMDGILLSMIRCLPQKSKFNISVDLVGRVGNRSVINSSVENSSVGSVGRYYVGIVAKMPLYSSIELERSVKRESDIRLKISGLIGSIANNVVVLKTALRELGLYIALEKRSKRRIRAGIAFTEEQVKYLQRVIAAKKNRNQAIAAINVSRLELIALCRENRRNSVNTVLINTIERAINASN